MFLLTAAHVSVRDTGSGAKWSQPYLKVLGSLLAQRSKQKVEVVVISQGAKVEVVFGIYTGGNIDVELKELQKVPFHLIPGRTEHKTTGNGHWSILPSSIWGPGQP